MKAGATWAAAWIVTWFDDITDMQIDYKSYESKRMLTLDEMEFK